MSLANGNGPNLFETAVRLVFESWPALQIAIKNQFGGAETQEKYNWFVEATTQWICEIGNLESDELEEFFLDTMDKEFNTILDDLSEVQAANACLKMWNLYRNTQFFDLQNEIQAMIQNLSSTQQSVAVSATNDESSSGEDDEGSGDEESQKNSNKDSNNNNYEAEMEGVEDGWTYVAKGGKHITK